MTATATEPAPADVDPRADVVAGARAMAPWLLGVVPFGLVIGVNAARADVPVLAGWLTAPLLFGGSAQVAVIDLLDRGAAPAVVVAAALAINARLVLYSATMAPLWRGTPRWWRALAAAVLVDPTLAVGVEGYERTSEPRRGHRRYAGAAVLLWVAWLAAVGMGVAAGTRLPAALQLEFVIPLFLTGEVVVRLSGRAARRAAGVAAAVAVLALLAPLQLGPLLAIAAGSLAGVRTRESGR